ncbi:Bud site selection protein, Revert to axial protein 1, partial [Ascosphaera pollenicola]
MSLLPTAGSVPLEDVESRDARISTLTSSSAAQLTANLPSSSITSTYSKLAPEEVARRLDTSLHHGISPVEADFRILRDGPNELPHDDPEPIWLRFLGQFKEPLIMLLLASAAISFFLGNYDDAISITLAVTIVIT